VIVTQPVVKNAPESQIDSLRGEGKRIQVCDKEIRTRGKLVRVAFLDGEGYQFLDNLDVALESVRASDCGADLFTFVQKLSDRVPRYQYPMEWDNLAVLPVSTFDHWMTHQIDFRVRNKIRKAAKNGLVAREVPFDDVLVCGIQRVYNESPIRQGRRFWHYGEDVATVRRTKSSFLERSIFIGVFFEDQVIGFAKLVANEDWTQAGLMHILSMVRHRDKAPTNALIAQAVRSCAERQIPHLWYANFSYGRKQHDSLADFKRYNGFQRAEVPRYHVPLTTVGRLALRMGLHHSIVDKIPEPIAAMYRKIRTFWYSKRFPASVGA